MSTDEMRFRAYAKLYGIHYTVRIFVCAAWSDTFANLGKLTMRPDEYKLFRASFKAEHIDETTTE